MIRQVTKFLRIWALAVISVSLISIYPGCATNQTAVTQTGTDIEKAIEPKLITDISTSENKNSFIVSLTGNQNLTYTSVKQPHPISVILYFPETSLDNIESSYTPDSSIVSSIKAVELTEKGHTSKIVISLKKDVYYEVSSKGSGIKVLFAKENEVPSPADNKDRIDKPDVISDNINSTSSSALKPHEKDPVIDGNAELLSQSKKTGNPENKKNETKSKKPATVKRVDFSSEESGKSTIIIETTKPVKYKVEKVAEKKICLKLFDTRLPSYYMRPLITTRFASAVDRIIPARSPAYKNTTLVSIELRQRVPYFVDESGNLLFIHFDKSSIPPKTLKEANLPPWQRVLAQTSAATDEKEIIKTTLPGKDRMPDFYGSTATKIYTGEKIALDFYKTDIKNVFRILREISGKNFAIDDDVSGKVTLSIEKPVSWDQVLDLILKMNQLGRVHEGEIIRIATLKTLEKEEDARKDKLKAKQEAALQEELATVFIPINYSDASEIIKLIQIEGKRGSISVDSRSNTIILTAVPKDIKRAKEIVQKIDKVTPQVIIEARVVEVSKNFSRSIGTQWSGSGGPINKQLGNIGGDINYNVAFNHAVAGTSTLGIDFTRLTGTSMLLNAQLTALQSEGKAKIISTPRILTLDNETAKIKQGLEYPYLERDDAGGSSVKFKDIDLLLEVTPHITPDQRISMDIKITKNDLAGFTQGVPSISTKEIETDLLVEDGDTIVIGGIVQSSSSVEESGTPWLSKIPVIGWMFKSKTKSTQNNELLIFITPTIFKI